MNHTLKISVAKEPTSGGIVSCRRISVRERFLRFLLGEKRRVAIIVPGDSVRELAISEVMEVQWYEVKRKIKKNSEKKEAERTCYGEKRQQQSKPCP